MRQVLVRAATATVIGAVAGLVAFVTVFRFHSTLTFEMDRDLPGRVTSGFYPVEVTTTESFAWTSDRAQLVVPGADRRVPWQCTVRARAGRPPGIAPPTLSMWSDLPDGMLSQPTVYRTSNDFQDLPVQVPPKAGTGLRLYIRSETFTPVSDPRPLGIQVDRVSCTPSAMVWPPGSALVTGMFAPAVLGAAFALIGLGGAVSAGAALMLAVVQAFPLSSNLGPYTLYVDRIFWLAFWIAAAMTAGIAALRWRGCETIGSGARFAVALSAAALFVKLLALLHPSKGIVDALFHAHRLEYVLSGRYFFTQVMPGGIQFPYAIALYVFAAPWAGLARDHVALLRIVVAASEAIAGLLLYWAVVRNWRDARMALVALLLYHLLPVSYWVAGNANLTNAFGQSAALAAMAALVVWTLDLRHWPQVLGVALLAAVAFLSHVSTFALLAVTFVLAAALFAWRGGPARAALSAAILGAVLATALYYGRPEFFPAYKSARDARAGDAAAAPAAGGVPVPTAGLGARIVDAAAQGGESIGWPILALAAIGAWRLKIERRPGRLLLALGAWLLAFLLFFLFAVAAPARVGQERYALEFVARAAYAASPAVLVLGAVGLAWMSGRGAALRVVAAGFVGFALFEAARLWISWMQ